jgi:hypothetical protein
MSMMFLAAAMMAQAPAVSAPQQPVQQAATAASEKKICKVDRMDTSSRLRKRICLSATEWEQKAAGKDANDLKSMGAR